ncbi:MAG: sensor domain-containing diguanylate cyclase [Euzebyales bacterium]|nr:sensor domain-containing diguanylate cyclase [Euzebyales bacterium]
MLAIAADISRRLDFETVAQRIVDAVIEVTDFAVATVTVREGGRCRRVATAGLVDGRIGMTTPLENWTVLLEPEWMVGTVSYLIPPEAPAEWADIPDIPSSDEPDAWTAEHGLIVKLLDDDASIIGFLAVDEPRSGRLPAPATVETLEVFALQAQVAFANARLYRVAQHQAQTMAKLFDVAKMMASTPEFSQVVPSIVRAVQERMDTVEVRVARLYGDTLLVHHTDSDRAGLVLREEPVTSPLLALADEIAAAGCLVINDLSTHAELTHRLHPRARSVLIAGKQDAGKLFMALTVTSDQEGAFSTDDRDFLRGLADITAVAMRNADLYEEVRFAAERDALTGLRNRRVFWVKLRLALEQATGDRPVALAVIDIDDFKSVNDQHGHDVGDRTLVHVAGRLEGGVRETDSVFRIGGEEFVILLPDTDPRGARMVLERVRESVKRSRLDLPVVTISAGVAVAPLDAATADELFTAADAALYRGKRAGKDRVEVE